MVFVGGPGQVVKTTPAKAILRVGFARGRYFNWDYDDHRQDILNKKWSDEDTLRPLTNCTNFPDGKAG